MSKGVIAEESLKQYLVELGPSNGFVVGLVLGQRSAQRDFVIHLPAFQNSQVKNDDIVSEIQTFQSVQEISIKNFTLYAKQVTAFLPGGMWVLGIFSCGSAVDGILDQKEAPRLQSLMNGLFTRLSIDSLLSGSNTPTPEKLVMHFNSSTSKLTCKSVNLGDSKWYLSNMEWKFQTQPIKWCEIESHFAFDFKMLLKGSDGITSVKSNLEELLKIQAKKIKAAHCFIDGEVYEPNTILDTIQAESGDTDANFNAELQLPCSDDEDVAKFKCSGDFLMNGHVYSRIYMHPKSTVEDVVNALKEDIVRSLRTRFELHTDALIDEEEGSPEEKVVQHDLPRRILIPLPFSQVKLSNYLFPGEEAKDSMASVQQVLGFEVDTNNVEEGLEEESDPDLMMPILPSEEIDLSCPQTPQPEPEHGFMSLYTALAIAIVFLALCTTLFLIRDEDDEDPPNNSH